MLTSWLDAVRAGIARDAVTIRPLPEVSLVEAVVEHFHGVKRAACVGGTREEALQALVAELERVAPWHGFAIAPGEEVPVLAPTDLPEAAE